MSGRVKLAPHPAKDGDGNPLFPHLRSIIADGYGLVGYTGDPPYHRIQFINWFAAQDAWIVTETKLMVEQEFGVVPDRVTSVMEPMEASEEDDD